MRNAREVSIFWFRRDLRLHDNHGLYRALESGNPVLPVFIFDLRILKHLPKKDARVEFILERVSALRQELRKHGSGLQIHVGHPLKLWPAILKRHRIRAIYTNEDYEPYAIARDQQVAALAARQGVEFYALKDQVIFAKDEVVKEDGRPYRMFTPYSRRWRERLAKTGIDRYPSEKNLKRLLKFRAPAPPTLKALGFEPAGMRFFPLEIRRERIRRYAETRDSMGQDDGTSHLGVHLRFGTLSVRELAAEAEKLSPVFLTELIWREFFQQILYHFPRSAAHPFDERFENVKWLNDKKQFQAWCEGRTGYPIVDAAMHQIRRTGYMHNRARMIAASFLSKHLLIDWRWGERYFAEKLLDYDMAANVGNWQWAAGCGCDAAPYFRVFNPELQAKRFDGEGKYVSKWDGDQNLEPIVDHKVARIRALKAFQAALRSSRRI